MNYVRRRRRRARVQGKKQDPEGGVTLRFESVDAFVDAVTFKQDMPEQLATGALRVDGSMQRLIAFNDAMMMLLHGLRPKA